GAKSPLERLDERVEHALRILALHRAVRVKDKQEVELLALQPPPCRILAGWEVLKIDHVRHDPDAAREHPAEGRRGEIRDGPYLVITVVDALPQRVGVLLLPRKVGDITPSRPLFQRRPAQ